MLVNISSQDIVNLSFAKAKGNYARTHTVQKIICNVDSR